MEGLGDTVSWDSESNSLFTNAFGLHHYTNGFVFQYKPNPESHFPGALGHGCQ
jgi:hypothetical protein